MRDSLDALSSERAGGHPSVHSATAVFMAANGRGVPARVLARSEVRVQVSKAPAMLEPAAARKTIAWGPEVISGPAPWSARAMPRFE